jgi:hypothetical protein
MSDQIIRAQSFPRLQHYASHHEFAPLGIRYSEDRRFTNRRMLVNNRFDRAPGDPELVGRLMAQRHNLRLERSA